MNKPVASRWKWLCCGMPVAVVAGGWLQHHALASRMPSPPACPAAIATGAPHQSSSQAIHAARANLPLAFEANQGQTNADVRFLARGRDSTLFLTATGAVLALGRAVASGAAAAGRDARRPPETARAAPTAAVLRMELVGAQPRPSVEGREPLPGKVSYLRGSDPARWHTNVPTYSRVQYDDVYPGIDLVYYGRERQLEYDFMLAPGADLRRITLRFAGARKLEVDRRGDLVLHTARGPVRQHRPVIYQQIGGIRHAVTGGYVRRGGHQIGFRVAAYDHGRPLVIDPVLTYAGYLGGRGRDIGTHVAVDPAGNILLAGDTRAADFPTARPLQPASGGGQDAFVAKLDPTGSALIYVTYLGGSGDDRSRGLEVDDRGNSYVGGRTISSDFPTTARAFQRISGGKADAFVAKLDPTGQLVYSTYVGADGTDDGIDLAVDRFGNAFITGQTYSFNFPTKNALQPVYGGGGDVFVTKLNADGSALVYATFLGGGNLELGLDIAVDAAGDAYVTGQTMSLNFPTVNALQPRHRGGSGNFGFGVGGADAFVARIDATGATLRYATFLGGSGDDVGMAVTADDAGNAYVTGMTESRDFPTVQPLQPVHGGGGTDAFVAKLSGTGATLRYATYLGGSGDENATVAGIALDTAGNTWVAGDTRSPDFPTVHALQPVYGGEGDAFVATLSADGATLLASTYFGGPGGDAGDGVVLDAAGSAYVTGSAGSAGLATAGAAQRQWAGDADVFVMKIVNVAIDVRPFASPNTVLLGSQGWLPVAILSSPGFSATALDPSTVRLGDPRLTGAAAPFAASREDVDGDGVPDLLLLFSVFDLASRGALDAGSTRVLLRGRTLAGGPFVAEDTVRIVP